LYVITNCALALHVSHPDGPTLQQAREATSEVLLLYTTSGNDRHYDALCLQARLNSRPGTPSVLRDADIMVYDNGGVGGLGEEGFQSLDIEDPLPKLARQSVDSFPQSYQKNPARRRLHASRCIYLFQGAGKQLYMTSKNVGYNMGAVQAVDTALHLGVLQKYKWVVHLHPDIFIVFPQRLAESLSSSSKSVITGEWGPCLTFNFFAFQPKHIDIEAFSKWEDHSKDLTGWMLPECYLSSIAFKTAQIERVPHTSIKHDTNDSWDEYGMWHQHDWHWIESFLEDHPKA